VEQHETVMYSITTVVLLVPAEMLLGSLSGLVFDQFTRVSRNESNFDSLQSSDDAREVKQGNSRRTGQKSFEYLLLVSCNRNDPFEFNGRTIRADIRKEIPTYRYGVQI
jgi:hypothetical protein